MKQEQEKGAERTETIPPPLRYEFSKGYLPTVNPKQDEIQKADDDPKS